MRCIDWIASIIALKFHVHGISRRRVLPSIELRASINLHCKHVQNPPYNNLRQAIPYQLKYLAMFCSELFSSMMLFVFNHVFPNYVLFSIAINSMLQLIWLLERKVTVWLGILWDGGAGGPWISKAHLK